MNVLKTLSTIIFIFLTLSLLSQSPLVYNQGVIQNNAYIHVNGNWVNDHANTSLNNEGEIKLLADNNPGDFYLLDAATVSGSGLYRVENDWLNSGVFIADSSHVYLFGDNEFITGDSISRFFNLTLEGTGVKTQTIDAEVKNQLNLNQLELATQSNVMYISNSWVDAIIYQSNYLNEGLVSSDNGGLLIRQIDSVYNYIFPVGSKINGHQYRPVSIENKTFNNEAIGVRMIPEDATTNGLDRSLKDSSICLINDEYYHEISGIFNPSMNDLSIYFDPNIELQWNSLSQWNTPSNNLWNKLNSTNSSIPNYVGRTVNDHDDYTNDFYALGYYNNVVPEIYGDTLICDTTIFYTYETDDYLSYDWQALNNGNDIGNSNNPDLDVQWINQGNNQLALSVVDSLGCISAEVLIDIDVAHVLADFDTLPGSGAGNILFNNTSLGADSYQWSIGTYTSTNENETYTFSDVGNYEIELIATNSIGCSDTITETLNIPALFWVPNVFTPNGEVGNDLFYIDALGINEYRLQIYDRWGLLLFESTNSAWDGTSQINNQPVPEGTYFFVYNATDFNGKKYQYTGPLSLFR